MYQWIISLTYKSTMCTSGVCLRLKQERQSGTFEVDGQVQLCYKKLSDYNRISNV